MHSPCHHHPVQRCVQLRHHHLPWQRTHDGPGQAMVVEHWIKVAKACQILRNYSSMNAIISALQSASIHRLKITWTKVSRAMSSTTGRRIRNADS
ncbi:ral guanine nucleotide dissociation stimulator-like [Canis lupus familiaris]|uniref:ral guanine nucleotide dissociation stimulator-like n=1 Tax=Canis lupus dingo TaxID=286419 RepID=UPI000DC74B13|nr:ral guanine nucleotide dissociation stimulator-like [Canis lupus dingo]XP_038386805.1 ral guanine nucleotide dissociation stimulator-like [Canis lupus familiaris]XP_038515103.1 ral guanine nucleotide dissociation stimulator-like [Canis lupus familiaris]XP_048953986.1 ral guanine nucleotide dissociation stimulator-like [Canis lupus dingo]